MLTPAEKQKIRKKLEEYEGFIDHIYRDSKGLATVAVGHMMPNVQAAQQLTFYTAKGTRATPAEIKVDYELVMKQPANRLAGFYKRFTVLKMKSSDADLLTNKHIESFYKELKKIYADYDKFPSDAKLALMDLIFNVGMPNLKNSWPTMNAAIKAKDWAKAAANSNRKAPISATRNKYVKDLFIKASQENFPGKTSQAKVTP